jgi:class 3 adenylate cyclase
MSDAVHQIPTHEREATLLFADMRGFTELAGSLEFDPLACELQSHVMDCLTDAVLENEGFVVDYFGDGLVAMWNAPNDQAAHADLACSAALLMLESLPAVTADWMALIHRPLRLGIGVHTGRTQIGNAGSSRQTKYGPRGPNVHLASRVEAATKELNVPLIATQPTVQRLSERFASNRICRATMPGLQQPVDLYAVHSSQENVCLQIAWQTYDKALRQFEQAQFQDAADTLATIDSNLPGLPSAFLLERVQSELGRQRRRRSTDLPAAYPAGVIPLNAK